MRKGIQNSLCITVEGVDLTLAKKIEVYLRQNTLFFQYTPEVVDATTLYVIVPKNDADLLRYGQYVEFQAALTDEYGNPLATDIVSVSVGDFLKAGGYDAVKIDH